MELHLNGVPPSLDDLARLALTPYGHFTSGVVEGGAWRGLHLHLQRLDRASRLLFGHGLPSEDIRHLLRAALNGRQNRFGVRITVYSRDFQLDKLSGRFVPDVLIRLAADPMTSASPPVSLQCIPYEREMPAIKHIATLGLMYHRRQARACGYDDALFVNRAGEVSEASVWNIGFIAADGGIVWPDALVLPGVTAQLLQSGLRQVGWPSCTAAVPRTALAHFRGAFLCNARIPVQPVGRIDHHCYAADPALFARLQACLHALPCERI